MESTPTICTNVLTVNQLMEIDVVRRGRHFLWNVYFRGDPSAGPHPTLLRLLGLSGGFRIGVGSGLVMIDICWANFTFKDGSKGAQIVCVCVRVCGWVCMFGVLDP